MLRVWVMCLPAVMLKVPLNHCGISIGTSPVSRWRLNDPGPVANWEDGYSHESHWTNVRQHPTPRPYTPRPPNTHPYPHIFIPITHTTHEPDPTWTPLHQHTTTNTPQPTHPNQRTNQLKTNKETYSVQKKYTSKWIRSYLGRYSPSTQIW